MHALTARALFNLGAAAAALSAATPVWAQDSAAAYYGNPRQIFASFGVKF